MSYSIVDLDYGESWDYYMPTKDPNEDTFLSAVSEYDTKKGWYDDMVSTQKQLASMIALLLTSIEYIIESHDNVNDVFQTLRTFKTDVVSEPMETMNLIEDDIVSTYQMGDGIVETITSCIEELDDNLDTLNTILVSLQKIMKGGYYERVFTRTVDVNGEYKLYYYNTTLHYAEFTTDS